jgi:hypothetical protein
MPTGDYRNAFYSTMDMESIIKSIHEMTKAGYFAENLEEKFKPTVSNTEEKTSSADTETSKVEVRSEVNFTPQFLTAWELVQLLSQLNPNSYVYVTNEEGDSLAIRSYSAFTYSDGTIELSLSSKDNVTFD